MNKAQQEAERRYPFMIGDMADTKAPLKQNSFIAGAEWQASQDGWISVEERLPTENDAIDGYVQAWRSYGQNGWPTNNCHVKWNFVCSHKEKFTHWMPLPNPPKQ